ncbi:MAG: DNA/RNA non-specific endonuclease, partial [Oscillospiraceae bacterium]|nr:DNA/RNA non-specific endonuclease [Oscillospiraceae bacterium]
TTSFERYSELDALGRCGAAFANVGTDLMPTEERGDISSVKPTGWHSVQYDFVDGSYLYNRCHLIGYQLTAENANEQNLITGTRYLNVEGMLPFENLVADYVQETENHVLYRVTPIFEGDNLVASGVQMEAMSVEDEGDGVLFNVYCYNVQPGVVIDYATGDSWEDDSAATEDSTEETTYILNTSGKKFHYPTCSSVDQISEGNRQEYTGSRDDLIAQGYEPCKRCNP